jgi:hypothetical protein
MSAEHKDDLEPMRELFESAEATPAIDRTFPQIEVPKAFQYMRKGPRKHAATSSSPREVRLLVPSPHGGYIDLAQLPNQGVAAGATRRRHRSDLPALRPARHLPHLRSTHRDLNLRGTNESLVCARRGLPYQRFEMILVGQITSPCSFSAHRD